LDQWTFGLKDERLTPPTISFSDSPPGNLDLGVLDNEWWRDHDYDGQGIEDDDFDLRYATAKWEVDDNY